MDFEQLVKARSSVRGYRPDQVEKEKMDKILQAARLAPTAVNMQPFRILVINTEGKTDQLKTVYHREWFSQAPVILGIMAVKSEAWTRKDGRNHAIIDATIVMDHMILAAAEQGLGTCWVCNFDPDAAREVFKIPPFADPVAFTPVGYPSEEKTKPKKRKELSDLVVYESW